MAGKSAKRVFALDDPAIHVFVVRRRKRPGTGPRTPTWRRAIRLFVIASDKREAFAQGSPETRPVTAFRDQAI
jgi:hypothetical protein